MGIDATAGTLRHSYASYIESRGLTFNQRKYISDYMAHSVIMNILYVDTE